MSRLERHVAAIAVLMCRVAWGLVEVLVVLVLMLLCGRSGRCHGCHGGPVDCRS